eukprot:6110070-Pyramimonas_sp.AAC.1
MSVTTCAFVLSTALGALRVPIPVILPMSACRTYGVSTKVTRHHLLHAASSDARAHASARPWLGQGREEKKEASKGASTETLPQRRALATEQPKLIVGSRASIALHNV